MGRASSFGPWRVVIAVAALLVGHSTTRAQRPDDAASVVPDAAAFYAAVRENLARAQASADAFSYKERRTAIHTNPFGRLGTDGVELYQVYPAADPRLTYRRLLERDGMALSEPELAKQDREHRAKAADLQRRLREESEGDRQRRADEEAQQRRRARSVIEDIVSALRFTISGRGLHDGQPAILVAFVGNQAFQPTTREGKIAQNFAGTVWIDAAHDEVMHVEARTTDDISFGFGIVARLHEGTTGSLTRRAVEPGLWLPTDLRLSGQGRAVLFLRKLTINYAVDWFDYQRMDGSR